VVTSLKSVCTSRHRSARLQWLVCALGWIEDKSELAQDFEDSFESSLAEECLVLANQPHV
jgi:hypothetical protein